MDARRRLVLKGMACSGIAGVATNAAAHVPIPATAAPVLALLDDGAAASAFLQGAMAASGPGLQAQRIGRELDFMLGFERRLRASQGLHVIGLLDDASGTLVTDIARSAGARVQWLGRHTAREGIIRHQRIGTDITAQWVQALLRGGAQTTAWARSTGHGLASLYGQAGALPRARPSHAVADGSFVSFSIRA